MTPCQRRPQATFQLVNNSLWSPLGGREKLVLDFILDWKLKSN